MVIGLRKFFSYELFYISISNLPCQKTLLSQNAHAAVVAGNASTLRTYFSQYVLMYLDLRFGLIKPFFFDSCVTH
jgi:hypothetical protein